MAEGGDRAVTRVTAVVAPDHPTFVDADSLPEGFTGNLHCDYVVARLDALEVRR
jgi:hypothetical protein